MNSEFTPKWLQHRVEDISLKYFNRPFEHIAVWNARLKTTGGRYHLKSHHLDFNPKVLLLLGEDEFDRVIKHELCHYHLHLKGCGYRHMDRDFKQLLKQVGGSRFVSWGNHERSQMKYAYECIACQQQFYRKRKLNTQRFVCGKCNGKLRLSMPKES